MRTMICFCFFSQIFCFKNSTVFLQFFPIQSQVLNDTKILILSSSNFLSRRTCHFQQYLFFFILLPPFYAKYFFQISSLDIVSTFSGDFLLSLHRGPSSSNVTNQLQQLHTEMGGRSLQPVLRLLLGTVELLRGTKELQQWTSVRLDSSRMRYQYYLYCISS